MHALIGIFLALALSSRVSYDEHNGLDPTTIVVFRNTAGALVADPNDPNFKTWLTGDGTHDDQERRVKAVGYFVACAFERDITISVGRRSWQGEFGLAQGLLAKARQIFKVGGTFRVTLDPEEGKWVSACLMAFSNMAGSHEYIMLRGNPPAWSLQHRKPSPAQRWTMGYPEGIFFADLLNFNVRKGVRKEKPLPATVADLEQSYTLSLNLPKNYPGLASAGWAPPNASNGRVLDYAHVTSAAAHLVGHYHVAENLGPYLGVKEHLVQTTAPTDPDYSFDKACVFSGRSVVSCGSQSAVELRPLVVHAPRVATLAAAGMESDSNFPISALDVGVAHLTPAQRTPCNAGIDCSGPFRPTAAGHPPAAPSADQIARVLTGLTGGQAVLVVLGFDAEKEHYQLDEQALKGKYTAIVRYRSTSDVPAKFEVSQLGGGTLPVGGIWKDTGGTWEWMQIYPVYVGTGDADGGGSPTLRITIIGQTSGAKDVAFDLAGFVPGSPWCVGEDSASFVGVCRDDVLAQQAIGRLPMVKQAIATSPSAGGQVQPGTPK